MDGASGGAGQREYRIARRLGGVTTRIAPPLRDRAALKRLATTPRTANDLRTALAEAGLSEIADDVIAAIATGDESRVREVTFPIGGRLDWMAMRRRGKVTIVRMVQWGGAAPFRGYEFTVDRADRVYTFLVPRVCANLSLVSSVAKAPPPAPAAVVAPPATAPTAAAATTAAASAGRRGPTAAPATGAGRRAGQDASVHRRVLRQGTPRARRVPRWTLRPAVRRQGRRAVGCR